jgi:RNA polymerase sigma factor (TIGR02999 family)
MSDVTRILNAIEGGDPKAADELLPLVYEELRLLAAQMMSQERPGQTLQATALVHEAYLRLVEGGDEQDWNSRGHFFKASAEAMRRILIENARRKRRIRHGGVRQRIDLPEDGLTMESASEDLLALDEALTELEVNDKTKAELVKLRYFAGLTLEQTAQALNISIATAQRYWVYAKAWLFRQIRR